MLFILNKVNTNRGIVRGVAGLLQSAGLRACGEHYPGTVARNGCDDSILQDRTFISQTSQLGVYFVCSE